MQDLYELVDCRTCRHYREPVSPTGLLEQETAGYFGRPVLQAISDLHDEEVADVPNELRELQSKQAFADQAPNAMPGLDRWQRRPISQPYCGLHEDQSVFYICDIKNHHRVRSDHEAITEGPTKSCNDHEPITEGPPKSCDSCLHNRTSTAWLILDRLREVMSEWPPAGSEEFQHVVQNYETVLAQQLRAARRNDGTLSQVPTALSYCAKRSATHRIAISALTNPTQQCEDWISGSPNHPEWLASLVELYRAAKTARVGGFGTTVRSDPKHIAQGRFIVAAMQALGLGPSAQTVVAKLIFTAQAERSQGAASTAQFARPVHLA
jgi:hypothetical protein